MFIKSNFNQSNLFINSPLEQFDVINLISFNAPIFGYLNITLTNFALYSLITLFLVLAIHIFSNNENKLLPSK
jgi:F-type H+-transporting ATPase subunit a